MWADAHAQTHIRIDTHLWGVFFTRAVCLCELLLLGHLIWRMKWNEIKIGTEGKKERRTAVVWKESGSHNKSLWRGLSTLIQPVGQSDPGLKSVNISFTLEEEESERDEGVVRWRRRSTKYVGLYNLLYEYGLKHEAVRWPPLHSHILWSFISNEQMCNVRSDLSSLAPDLWLFIPPWPI